MCVQPLAWPGPLTRRPGRSRSAAAALSSHPPVSCRLPADAAVASAIGDGAVAPARELDCATLAAAFQFHAGSAGSVVLGARRGSRRGISPAQVQSKANVEERTPDLCYREYVLPGNMQTPSAELVCDRGGVTSVPLPATLLLWMSESPPLALLLLCLLMPRLRSRALGDVKVPVPGGGAGGLEAVAVPGGQLTQLVNTGCSIIGPCTRQTNRLSCPKEEAVKAAREGPTPRLVHTQAGPLGPTRSPSHTPAWWHRRACSGAAS